MRLPMRFARSFAFCCVAAIATTASAKKLTLQFGGSFNLGWTDNVLNTPSATRGALFPQQAPIADFFGDIRPSLVFTTASARIVQQLSYTFSYTYFFRNASANGYSNTLSWSGAMYPSRRSELVVSIITSQSEVTTQSFATDPATPVLLRPGRVNSFSWSAREQLSHEITSRVRLGQTLTLSITDPITPKTIATNLTIDLGGTLDYTWRKTALGAIARVNYFQALEQKGQGTLPDGTMGQVVVSPAQGFFTTTAMLRWRQDFGNFWTSELGLGVLHTVGTTGLGHLGPSAAAALRYSRPEASASLTYAHASQPSPFLAQNFLSDSIALAVSAPLGSESKVSLNLSASYTYSRQLLGDGSEGGRAHQATGDVSLTYTPIAGLSLYLRGQATHQLAIEGSANPLASVFRNSILIGINGFYPPQAAAIVPRALASRVDGTDRVLIQDPSKRDNR